MKELSTNIQLLFAISSKIGSTTLATYIAIEKYNPIIIINEGTTGSHAKNIYKSDIVIGSQHINISSLKTPPKREGEGTNSL